MGIRRGSISTPIIADGLVFNIDPANRASYPKTGTNVFNTLNASISGSFANDVAFNSSPSNFEFGLDGIDDYIDCGDHSVTKFTTPFSISVWANRSGTGQGSFPTIYSSPKDSSFHGGYTIVPVASNSKFRFYVDTTGAGGWQYAESNSTITNGNWYNLVGVWNGSTIILYSNGVAQTTTASVSQIVHDTTAFNGFIGRYVNDYFQGKVSNLYMYNRALSANEVLHNYNALKSRFGL